MKMKTILTAAALLISAATSRAEPYQATGPVLEVTDAKIVIQKGKEKWEFARTADLKVNGDLKVGTKVTIQYTMTATAVDVKEGKAEKPAAKPAPKTEEKAPAKPIKKAA